MSTWGVVLIVVVLAVIVLAWIGNSYRLAQKNNNVARRSPTALGSSGPEVDEQNRSVAERRRTEGS